MIVGAIILAGGLTLGTARDDPEQAIGAAFRAQLKPLELRRALVFTGEEAVPALFDVWVNGRVPASWLQAEEPILLSSRQLEVVRDALGALPRKPVVRFLGNIAAVEAKVSTRVAGIRLLEAIGDKSEADLVFALASPAGEPPIARPLKEAVVSCLEAWHERGALRTGDFGGLLKDAPGVLTPQIARVVAGVDDSEAGRVLAGFLGTVKGLDSFLLNELARRGRSGNELIDEDIAAEVRSLLRRGRLDLTSGIARIAALYRDEGAMPLLLDAAREAPEPELFTALAEISGIDFGTDLEAWLRWYEREQEWWAGEGAEVLRTIETGNGARFTASVRQALKHRLNRRRIEASLAVRLRDDNPACVSLALSALGQLGTSLAVPEIEGCLEHPAPEVRKASERALQSIQGRMGEQVKRPGDGPRD